MVGFMVGIYPLKDKDKDKDKDKEKRTIGDISGI